MATSTEDKAHVQHASPVRYLICWGLLAVLTGVTFALSNVEMGSWALTIAMLIAIAKATVVSLFFMHLWDHRGANRLVFVVSILFVLVLMALTIVDSNTRFPLSLPPH